MDNALIPALGVATALMTVVLFIVLFISPIVLRRMVARGNGPNVVSETVTGDEAAQRKVDYYLSHGYDLQSNYTRKMWWKLTNTLTFVKRETNPESVLNDH